MTTTARILDPLQLQNQEIDRLKAELDTARSNRDSALRDAIHANDRASILESDLAVHEQKLSTANRALEEARKLVKALLSNNGGPIDGDTTTDGKDYVMVLRTDFDALSSLPQQEGGKR